MQEIGLVNSQKFSVNELWHFGSTPGQRCNHQDKMLMIPLKSKEFDKMIYVWTQKLISDYELNIADVTI